uniref:Uncharacterized protein n=1 Tax=Neogobius melanostomus TaxID=47308 RepID=A0A8C6U1E2_9GOBI
MLIVRIWRKQNENMDPSCLVSTVQAGGGGVMVWGMFSWPTLGPLVLSTRGMPYKTAQFRGLTADLATLMLGIL